MGQKQREGLECGTTGEGERRNRETHIPPILSEKIVLKIMKFLSNHFLFFSHFLKVFQELRSKKKNKSQKNLNMNCYTCNEYVTGWELRRKGNNLKVMVAAFFECLHSERRRGSRGPRGSCYSRVIRFYEILQHFVI